MTARREFPNSPASVGEARRFVRAQLTDIPGGNVPDRAAEDVIVMTSELATNCVRHTVTDFSVSVDASGREIRVEVTDHGGGVPVVRSPGPYEPSGRGLRIVQELSDSFGITETRSDGKTVWFVVSLEERSGAQSR